MILARPGPAPPRPPWGGAAWRCDEWRSHQVSTWRMDPWDILALVYRLRSIYNFLPSRSHHPVMRMLHGLTAPRPVPHHGENAFWYASGWRCGRKRSQATKAGWSFSDILVDMQGLLFNLCLYEVYNRVILPVLFLICSNYIKGSK